MRNDYADARKLLSDIGESSPQFPDALDLASRIDQTDPKESDVDSRTSVDTEDAPWSTVLAAEVFGVAGVSLGLWRLSEMVPVAWSKGLGYMVLGYKFAKIPVGLAIVEALFFCVGGCWLMRWFKQRLWD